MKRAILGLSIGAIVLTAGCGSYYKVTDPTTGKVYYTEKLKSRNSGATTLTDARTGDTVSLQNSEVKKITKDQFKEGQAVSGTVPDGSAK